MSAMTEDVIKAIAFIPSADELNWLRDEVSDVLGSSAPLDPHAALQEAIQNLRQRQKFSSQLEGRLTLAVEVARLSGNNEALVRAVDERSNVNNMKDFAARFDTAAISMAIAPSGVEAPSEAHAAEAAAIRAAVIAAVPEES